MSTASERLIEIRSAIDKIDAQLLELVAERARLGVAAGRAKSELGEPVRDLVREAEILERITARGAAPLSTDDVRALWELLMSATRRAEEREERS